MTQIAVTDQESKRVYTATLEELDTFGWRFDRGFGPQVGMRLSRFHVDGAPLPTAPTPEPIAPAAVQLALFGGAP